MGLVFAVADLAALNADIATLAVATALGAALGWASARFGVNEVATGATAVGTFFVCGLLTRGGMTPSLLWTCFPAGCTAAWLAWRRQDRGC